jgi:hypothetical protein
MMTDTEDMATASTGITRYRCFEFFKLMDMHSKLDAATGNPEATNRKGSTILALKEAITNDNDDARIKRAAKSA